ncbi:MAG: toprim domain-containing protein, partial [Tannerellaceae bacterium]|nr:toprim domain-containing protein [Tannerellaceae bacterium]
CRICADTHRDHAIVCVVENIKEVMAIENTGQFRGVYHVLGGKPLCGWLFICFGGMWDIPKGLLRLCWLCGKR